MSHKNISSKRTNITKKKLRPFNIENPVRSRAGKHADHNLERDCRDEDPLPSSRPGKKRGETPRDIERGQNASNSPELCRVPKRDETPHIFLNFGTGKDLDTFFGGPFFNSGRHT